MCALLWKARGWDSETARLVEDLDQVQESSAGGGIQQLGVNRGVAVHTGRREVEYARSAECPERDNWVRVYPTILGDRVVTGGTRASMRRKELGTGKWRSQGMGARGQGE